MAELSIIKHDIFKFFPTPPHLEPEMKMKLVEFLTGLVCLIIRWTEHIMRQTRISSVKNSGRDPQMSHTHIHTEQAVARHRFIH
jgi:hypothetical protein